jgi:hypothetical protein
MVRRKGGAEEGMDAALNEMVILAETQSAGALKRPLEEPTPPPPSQRLRVDNDGAIGTMGYNPFDVVPAPASAALTPKQTVLKSGLTKLLEKIKTDGQAVRDISEQVIVDGLGFAYDKVTRKLIPASMVSTLVMYPAPISWVMKTAQIIAKNIPSPTWVQLATRYGSVMSTAGETALTAASFATTPKGVVMIGGILLSAAAAGAGKSVPEYVGSIGGLVGEAAKAKTKAVIGDIKKELDKHVTRSLASELNADIKKQLADQKIAMDAVLDIAKAADEAEAKRVAEEAEKALAAPPAGGRRRKTKKRVTKKRTTRRRLFSY